LTFVAGWDFNCATHWRWMVTILSSHCWPCHWDWRNRLSWY